MEIRVGDVWRNGGGAHERYEILKIGYHGACGIVFDFVYLDGEFKGHHYRDGVLQLALNAGDHIDEVYMAKRILESYG
jgi:hypothetical protein